jgi:molybdopterin-guanine dinucleotide biosynthesis protein A
MPRIAAVILAGGQGERMGGAIKANLVVGGRRLLDRVAERLGDAAPVVVARGPLDPARLNLAPEMVGIPDLAGNYGGPLAGFAAAVDWLSRFPDPPQLLLSAAADTPFLPPDYLGRLLAEIGEAQVAVASFRGQQHPTSALWRFDAVAGLPRRLLDGTAPHSLKRLIAGLGGVIVDWAGTTDTDPFASVNTPAELAAAQVREAATAHNVRKTVDKSDDFDGN